ncbi:MAG TPA: GNAT family protein [Acidobacteriaceae bacterium]|jgi:RimJ/RimL family protein N-acetyltransferase|nr:GNAT family protein [Acidobacteriaceae bacterium]
MKLRPFVLEGRSVRLEPLELRHVPGLVAAAAVDPALYRQTTVPQGEAGMRAYVEAALRGQEADAVVPFAKLRAGTDEVIGATRFFDVEWWPWPEGHAERGRTTPDVGEIGYTWLRADAIRTAVNTEAKLMMLQYAFEVWRVHRVCLHTDERNVRSRAAIERIGGRFEGILRAHRMASDFIPRNSARYSITAAEWPEVQEKLTAKLRR